MEKGHKSLRYKDRYQTKKCTKPLNYGLLAGTVLLSASLGLTSAQAAVTNSDTGTSVKETAQVASETPVTSENQVSLGKTSGAPKDADAPEKITGTPDSNTQVANDAGTDSSQTAPKADLDTAPKPVATINQEVPSKQQLVKVASANVEVPAGDDTDTNETTTPAHDDTTTTTDYASAMPIYDNPKAVLPDGKQKLDGKYAFIPKFNGSGTTAVSVIGTEKVVTKKNTIAADLVNATKGAVGFKYTNIGYDAEGHSMDMNILYMDWGRLDEVDAPYVETYTTIIYSNFRGAGWGDVKYQFVRSDSGNPENVTGLITLTDIDGNQTVSLTDSQWANIDNVYIPEGTDPMSGKTDNWLRYKENNGYLTLVSPNSGNTPSDGQYSMLTFTYSNQNSLTFRYSDGLDGTLPTKLTA